LKPITPDIKKMVDEEKLKPETIQGFIIKKV